jgi:hypothetical protein
MGGVEPFRGVAAAPNEGLEPTPSSVRCAPASGRGSRPAFSAVSTEVLRAETWIDTLYLTEHRRTSYDKKIVAGRPVVRSKVGQGAG